MAKRIKVGIIYSYDENWIGGTYYYQNLIQSLNLLPDTRKPELVVLSNSIASFDSIKALNYPFITYIDLKNTLSFFEKFRNKITRRLFPQRAIPEKKIKLGIDVLFHPSEVQIPNTIKKHLYWIPDFQEVYLPHLFSGEYLNFRKKSQQELLSSDKHIIFSSNDARNDFEKLYPSANSKKYVVNFSVFHPNYSTIDITQLKKKYELEDVPYFFSPNQFWKHKNHIVVLKAVKRIKENYNFNILVLFSGKESDSRNPTYFEEIKQFVSENNLQDNIKFLGFIDRSEQLCFMKNALAVIQPSLFEGWSSVVEDAKAMNQNLIVSSLNVHKEQLGDLAYYFNPNDEKELLDQIILFLEDKIRTPEFNYNEQLHLFGEKFMEVITTINLK
jgi:glycosyltransferase involved in cell wall biosynthesis